MTIAGDEEMNFQTGIQVEKEQVVADEVEKSADVVDGEKYPQNA